MAIINFFIIATILFLLVKLINSAQKLGKKEEIVEEVATRSEEHTSELQSHNTISYAVFCL